MLKDTSRSGEPGGLEREARAVLELNDRGTHTIPAAGMYPHEWLWDEALTDIGIRHYDPRKAAAYTASIFNGQWQNGMVPNMQFTKGKLFGNPPYRPDHLGWSSRLLNANAPRHVATSGITQPPVIAEAMQLVGNKLERDDRNDFYDTNIGKLIAFHEWIYKDRNYAGDGLFTAVHPWETGMENTPTRMQHMAGLDWGAGGTVRHKLGTAFQHLRRDTRHADAEERASVDEGLLYIDGFIGLVKARYSAERLADNYPLHIKDVHMNSILIRNNDILQQLASENSFPLSDELKSNMDATQANLETLWDHGDRLYYPQDAVTGKPIKIPTIASLMPLYAGVSSSDRTDSLVDHLGNPDSFDMPYGVPTVPQKSEFYREKGYWSGPTWVNMNWFLIDGLQRQGYRSTADTLRHKTLSMVAIGGMREYFSAKTAQGLGAKDFSWTSALTIDLIQRNKMDV